MTTEQSARFLRYMGPVVEAIQQLGHSARPRQVVDAIQQSMDISPQDLERKSESGQSVFENDIYWCQAYLADAGYVGAIEDGVWTLTPKGRTATVGYATALEIHRTAFTKCEPEMNSPPSRAMGDDNIEEIEEDADGLEYRAQALETLKNLSPTGFERFCRQLLLETGFKNVDVTDRCGDSRIDGHGILKVNPLFSLKVAFLAKRYQETVGSAIVHDFRGAIVGRADRGLLITTGRFTREAEFEAARDGATRIELIDGPAIVDLMRDLKFGLKPVSTYQLDRDLFDRFEVE